MSKHLYALVATSCLAAGLVAAPQDQLREEFHQTYALSPDGSLSLKNVNGGVRVAVWERNEVKVDAIKTAKDQATLAATEIAVEAKPDSIAIRTHSKDEHRLANVEYTLTVPRRVKIDSMALVNGRVDIDGVAGPVHAKSVNGSIDCRNLGGEVDLSTVNGAVHSALSRFEPNTRVSLKSVNGLVEAMLPASASAQLKARTVHGRIDSDFGAPATGQKVGQSLETVLGSGGSPIQLSTVNGGIRIKKQ